jgi:hypothetical protein
MPRRANCPVCDKSFHNQRGLHIHYGRKHGKIVDEEEPEEKVIQMTLPGRPTLVMCGKHLVNPEDVSRIRYVKSNGLYVVDFKSQQEAKYAFWLNVQEVQNLLSYFNVVGVEN